MIATTHLYYTTINKATQLFIYIFKLHLRIQKNRAVVMTALKLKITIKFYLLISNTSILSLVGSNTDDWLDGTWPAFPAPSIVDPSDFITLRLKL